MSDLATTFQLTLTVDLVERKNDHMTDAVETSQGGRRMFPMENSAVGVRTQKRDNQLQSGITLIEMLVVITIIALFSAVAYQRLTPALDEGRKTAAAAQIDSLMAASQLYNIEHGRFPNQEQGMDALRPYLQKEIPLDRWNNAYVYHFPGKHGPEPDILSYCADGVEGGEDSNADIVSWK